jgi:integrase
MDRRPVKGSQLAGSRRPTSSSARSSLTHNTYAQRTGKIAKNVAREIKRDEDLPRESERERRYLTHAEFLRLAKATDRFETLTLVLGYCGLRFGEAAALRRRHVGDKELTVTASATAVAGQGIVESTTKT